MNSALPSLGQNSGSTSTPNEASPSSSSSSSSPSATMSIVPNIASVHFKVRCEQLGHGEDVYLVPFDESEFELKFEELESSSGGASSEEDVSMGEDEQVSLPQKLKQELLKPPSQTSREKMIPLYTTATGYPWYSTTSALQMPSMKKSPDTGFSSPTTAVASTTTEVASDDFRYRYAVFRAGVFYRWEDNSDENFVSTSDASTSDNTATNATVGGGGGAVTKSNAGGGGAPIAMDVDTSSSSSVPSSKSSSIFKKFYHSLPLRLLAAGETYVVNDVLGARGHRPDIYHKRPPTVTGGNVQYIGVVDGEESTEGATTGSDNTTGASGAKKKRSVGFAPSPQSYANRPHPHQQHPSGDNSNPSSSSSPHPSNARRLSGEQVHLNSTDGLVVVSVFLPVVVHREETQGGQPNWTCDWDYEALLSMQTHLRVTRVGIVKWKGWHGNYSANQSQNQNQNNKEQQQKEEHGVPINERHLVEECLRPFNCVPVWIDPLIFGEMYNGFCKGILWPVLHNVTSVYASHKKDEEEEEALASVAQANSEQQQFSELCRDDVEQGPIHGGRGREKGLWNAYNQVNRKFSEVVVQCFNEGDLVWVHGFHLLILPSYLTRRISMAKVGIFLHTPFPSSEIFRTLWCREDLLRGILNADQVGFHLFEYARHFLTCCRRLLGLNYGMIPDASGYGGYTLAIDTNGRHVAVTSIHAGIEPPVLNQILRHESVLREAHAIRQRHPTKTIFCSIDKLESLKGIPLKLLAMERFLKRCPEWIGKIVLIQIGITAWERGDDYIKNRNEVTEMVNGINKLYPGTVVFQEMPDWRMRLQQRLALMKASDVVLVTPIRDGLNLIPLEFTIAHQDALTPDGLKDGRRRGLVILSEFASCTRVMRGALHVNPWKISEIAFAFRQALTMSDEERLKRVTCASEFVTRVTTQRWALAVMLDLKGVHKSVSPVKYSGTGLGLGFRLLGMDSGFESLDFKAVAKAYKITSRRLILFDYGGTITSNDNLDNLSRFMNVKQRRNHSEPTEQMIQTIQELCGDKKNTVFVVSGKERHALIKTLGHIPNLGLAAEHGMYISWPETDDGSSDNYGSGGDSILSSPGGGSNVVSSSSKSGTSHHKRRWETLVPITDRSWRLLAMSIMEVYTSRTHGSYIEETEMKVLWQYRDSDLEFGYCQARELEDHLSNVLRSYPVDILHGGMEEGGYVEVRPKGVNKGVFAMKAIRNFDKFVAPGGNSRVDFALVLGDDHCDEPMLSVMRQIGSRACGMRAADLPMTMTLWDVSSCDPNVQADMECFTCTVGKKPSAAANYLQDVHEVEELLQALVKVSKNPNASKSMLDLMMMSAAAEAKAAAALPSMIGDQSSNAANPLQGGSSLLNARGSSGAFVPGSIGDYLDGIDDEEEDIFF